MQAIWYVTPVKRVMTPQVENYFPNLLASFSRTQETQEWHSSVNHPDNRDYNLGSEDKPDDLVEL